MNATRFSISQAGRYVCPVLDFDDLRTPEGWKTELMLVIIISRDGLPVHKYRQSPIQGVTT